MKLKYWFVLAFVGRLILSFGQYHPDLGNHLDWGLKFWQLGPANFYGNSIWQVSWANQPPGTIYVFALMGLIYKNLTTLVWWLNINLPIFPSAIIPWVKIHLYPALVKLPFILSDMGLAILAGKIVSQLKNEKLGNLITIVFLFNPVFWYISAIWGQTESLINLLCLSAIYLFLKNKPYWGIAAFIFSFFFKVSLLIFLPIFLLWLIKSNEIWWKKLLVVLMVPLVMTLFSLPFTGGGNPLLWMYHLYLDRVIGHQGNMLTANAFNLWAFIYGIDFTRTDLIKPFLLNLKQWGVLLFGMSYLIIYINLLKKKVSNFDFLISLVFVAFSSFLFMTNMHERYLYPAVVLLSIFSCWRKNILFVYLFICIIWLLNLYHLWFYPRIDWLVGLYIPTTIKVLSSFNLLLFGYLVVTLFKSELYVKSSPKV